MAYGVAMFTPDRTEFKTNSTTKRQRGYHIIIKEVNQEADIALK